MAIFLSVVLFVQYCMEKNNAAFRFQLLAIVLGFGIMGVKFAAYFITHSNSVFTDALESIVNILAGGVSLYSIWLSAHPRDRNHPYGHGKVEFLAGGFEGGLIFLAGWVAVVKAVIGILDPRNVEHLDWGIWLVIATGFLNYLIGLLLTYQGNRHGSIALTADGEHLKSDAYTSLGILVGIGAVYLGAPLWVDAVVALVFGLFIVYSGFKIFRSSLSGIMDEANPDILEKISSTLEEKRLPGWIDVHNLRVIQFGGLWHVDAHITLPFYMPLEEAHQHVVQVEDSIKSSNDAVGELFIHADPCVPPSCSVCQITTCSSRFAPFQKRIPWTTDHLVTNSKHHSGL